MKRRWLLGALFLCMSGISATNSNSAKTINEPPEQEGGETTQLPAVRPPSEVRASQTNQSSSSAAATTLEASASPDQKKLFAMLDLRPSWYGVSGRFDTENTVEIGYRFNSDRLLSYTQYWNTNLDNPTVFPQTGVGLLGQDGFFRYRMKNLWVSADKTWSLTWDPRLYMPTDPYLRQAGLIAYTRQYVVLAKKLADNVTLSFMEIPFYYGFDRAGAPNVYNNGAQTANPVFENREYFVLDFSLAKGLIDVSMNVLINHQRTRNYASNALFNDRWVHTVWTWPEIDFNVTPNSAIGVSWESGNFIKDDFSGFDVDGGFKNGEAQIVLRTML